MSVQHSALRGTELHPPFSFGTDASKPASPAVGDWYYATDTDVLYKCKSIGVWSQQKGGVSSGTYANLPATATVGDLYFCTDRNIMFECLATNVWSILTSKKAATFTNGDLSTGVLTITHNLALSSPYAVDVLIFDNNNKQVLPDDITGSTNSVAVDLTSYGALSGTWSYIVRG